MRLFRRRREAAEAVSARIPEGQRVYAIGDVHGRMDLLERLLNQIEADSAGAPRVQIVFLGDYIDRGTESRAVIDCLVGLGSGGADIELEVACLRGNHEAMLLSALDESGDWESWLVNGGYETLFSYGVEARDLARTGRLDELGVAARAAIPPAHLDFLRGLPASLIMGDYFFCHAGIRPGIPLDRQDIVDLLWIRDEFTSSSADHGKRVVHGHTPVMEPDIRPNRINIDTGAYLTNRLSCAVLERDAVRILHT
ncbi:MAG TPA: metallophosphoesterase family protein [Xanthobacteraceae bacterium]|nr:metallophosphoesterase family protein [Xanthobacteraceae bacterium]